MKKPILLPILTIAICALLLFGLSTGLSGMYLNNARQQHLADLENLLPGGKDFVVEPYSGEDANIRSVHKCDVGYVIETASYGYAGEITVLVGVSNEGKVTGIVVRDLSETVGLGANALTDVEFLAQFLNTDGNLAVGTPGEADAFSGATGTETTGEETYVDAIAGATVTSKAIVRCVNSATGYVTGADATSAATSWGG